MIDFEYAYIILTQWSMTHLTSYINASTALHQKARNFRMSARACVMQCRPPVLILVMNIDMVILNQILNHWKVTIICSFEQCRLVRRKQKIRKDEYPYAIYVTRRNSIITTIENPQRALTYFSFPILDIS